MCMFSKPKPPSMQPLPKAPPPASTIDSPEVAAAGEEERRRRQKMGGQRSTIITSGKMDAPVTERKMLLGS